MNCPKCGGEMDKGEATVEGTALGFMVFDFSHQHLWFRSPNGEKEKIVPSNGTTVAYRCSKCRLITVIEGTALEESLGQAGKRLGQAYRRWKAVRQK